MFHDFSRDVFIVTETEYLKIGDLKPGFRNINTIVEVVSVGEPRVVFSQRDRSEHKVTEALVGDSTGAVLLTLWDDQITRFIPGEEFEIRNGYTSLFKGSLRLNIGRYGEVEKVEDKIEEVNTDKNLSEERHETAWRRPSRRPFTRSRRRY
jgi:replication factor A1